MVLFLLAACGDDPQHCLAPTPPSDPVAVEDPNTLLIVLDDVGLDLTDTWPESDDAARTPTLSELSASGVRFDRAYANPTCSPTRASMFTGRHPSRHGIGTWISPLLRDHSLSVDEQTLAEVAVQSGRSTALVGKWHLSTFHDDAPERDPHRHGFERFDGVFGNPRMRLGDPDIELGYYRWEHIRDGEITFENGYLTTRQIDDTLVAIEELPEPWFIVLSLNAAHSPWHPPPGRLVDGDPGTTEPELMRTMVEVTDRELGRLFRKVDTALLDRTDVVVIGDNGSAGDVMLPPFDPANSKQTVGEGGIRVPMTVCGPSIVNPGRVSSGIVHAMDLFSTLTSAWGETPEAVVDGVDLGSVWADQGDIERQPLFIERFTSNGIQPRRAYDRALVTDRWKLQSVDGVLHLYDLEEDAWERGRDLVVEPTDESARIQSVLVEELGRVTVELNPL